MSSTPASAHAPVPCVWITGSAAEAAQYYADIFDDVSFVDNGVTAELTIHGRQLILLGADDSYTPNPAISGLLNFDPALFGGKDKARAYLERCHDGLSEGGELMPLGEYPFSAYYSWVRDRYGFTWQLMPTDEASQPAPFLLPALMFGGPNHGNCLPATDFYMSLFDGHRPLLRKYEDDGVPEKGSVEFSNVLLGGQWFAAMDAGAFHDFTFSPGVSLVLSVPDQHTLDAYWEALSAVREAERCGWCQDQWGVSWQIVPANLGELMAE